MRRRARKMRHAVQRQALEMLGNRLAGARQHERNAAEHRAQENLQAAVAADVVERAPDHGAVGRLCPAIGAVRPARLCTTIFGTPVVPDVSSTHSVAHDAAGSRSAGHDLGGKPRETGSSNAVPRGRVAINRRRRPPRRRRSAPQSDRDRHRAARW